MSLMPVLNVMLLMLAFVTAFVAIGGETWKQGDASRRGLMTRRGWISVACLSMTLVLGIVKEVVNETELSKARAERLRSETQLRVKTEEIADLNRKIAATVTGGDTFPYLLVGRPGGNSQEADLMLLTDGDYPLYDVSVRIQDVDRFVSSVVNSFESGEAPTDSILKSIRMMQRESFERVFGNLSPNQMIPFGSINLSGREEASFNVILFARNGSVHQKIKFRRLNDEWAVSYRVTRENETLLESIHVGLPLD